jgi:phosphonate transport system ATP-binding protein
VTAVLAGRLPHWSLAKALGSLWHAADAELAYQALQAFSLEHKLWSRVDRLSGGERQRVGLARALVADARALFVDEPLSALDPALAAQTLQMLTRHAAGRGATLVCSLHQVDLALAHFPRVVGLRDGQVLFDEAPAQIGAEQVKRLYFERETGSPAEAANVAVMLDRPPPVAPSRCT